MARQQRHRRPASWRRDVMLFFTLAVGGALLVTTTGPQRAYACSTSTHTAEMFSHNQDDRGHVHQQLQRQESGSAADEPLWINYEDYSSPLLSSLSASSSASSAGDEHFDDNGSSSSSSSGRRLLSTSRAAAEAADAQRAAAAAAWNATRTGAAGAARASGNTASEEKPGPRCGTRHVSLQEHGSVNALVERVRRSKTLHIPQTRTASLLLGAEPDAVFSVASAAQAADDAPLPAHTVNLYFHVITGTSPAATVDAPPELLAAQLDAMNSAYGAFNIRFALKGVTRVVSEPWAATEINSSAEDAMKARLRRCV